MAKKNRAMEKEKEGKTQSNQPPNKTNEPIQRRCEGRTSEERRRKTKKRTYNLTLNYIQITLNSIYIIQ